MKKTTLIIFTLLAIILIQGCAVNKELVPTGGSRADGIVKLSYEFGLFEAPKLDPQQGLNAAKQRCTSWGYKNAEMFGGSTKSCINTTNNGCNRWLVSVEYQCTEYTLNTATQITPNSTNQPTSASTSNANERMTNIKELKDKGLLTQEEYEAKRQEILKGL